MAKYRAVLMVPSVVEFENPGDMGRVTEQARRIADGLGKARSEHPWQGGDMYTPKLVECVLIEGDPPSPPKPNINMPVDAA